MLNISVALQSKKIPLSKPYLTARDISAVKGCIEKEFVSGNGPANQRFEKSFASLLGVKNCSLVANGSVALELALSALSLSETDEVIVPTLTFVATANAVKFAGAKLVFADVDPKTWCLSIDTIKSKITNNTKAVIFVSLYGNPSGLLEILDFCRSRSIVVIEDAAEALFAKNKEAYSGSIADISTFSFFGNKLISCGEGGALTTNSDEYCGKINELRDQGADKSKRYQYSVIGHNYRLSNLQSSLLESQLSNYKVILKKRNEVFANYFKLLRHKKILFQHVHETVTISPWLFTLRVEGLNKEKRDLLIEYMAKNRIETRPMFYPIHTQKAYIEHNQSILNNASNISYQGISLPTFPSMTRRDVARIVEVLHSYLDKNK